MNRPGVAAVLLGLVVLASMPVVAHAAKPNELRNPAVSPTRGTTATVFTFSVRYLSDKDFAATRVVAIVAGRAVSLRLVSGDTSNGTFQGTAKLPGGRWAVSFEAQGAKGPKATVIGPSLVVEAPPPPKPKPKPVPSHAPPPPPTPRPVATAPPASAKPRARPSAPSSRTPSPTPTGTSRGPVDPSSPSPSPSLNQVGGIGGDGNENGVSDRTGGSPLVWLIPLALLALSTGILVAMRRRSSEDEAPTSQDHEPSLPQTATTNGNPPSPREQTEDPILAAMGLGTRATQQSPVDAPISRSVRFGRGERPREGNTGRLTRR